MFCNVLPERAGSRVPQVTQYQADPGVRPSLVMSLLPPAGSGQSHLMGAALPRNEARLMPPLTRWFPPFPPRSRYCLASLEPEPPSEQAVS
jgi:hypothetical protein